MEKIATSKYQRDYFRLLSRYCSLLIKRKETLRKIADFESDRRLGDTRKGEAKKFQARLNNIRSSIKSTRAELRAITKRASKARKPIALESIVLENGLSEMEWSVLVLLSFEDIPLSEGLEIPTKGSEILECLVEDSTDLLLYRSIFYKNSTLLKENLIGEAFGVKSGLSAIYQLTNTALLRIMDDPSAEIQGEKNEEDGENPGEHNDLPRIKDILEFREPRIKVADVVLPENVRSELNAWLNELQGSHDLIEKWGVKYLPVQGRNNTILLYGPPGTGKTMTAEGIAGSLNKQLLIAKYEQIHNCWYGNSEKIIAKIFDETQKRSGVLLFDECDAIFSHRIDHAANGTKSDNKLVSLLLQKLESFIGVVILTSNFAEAIDHAFERRIGIRLELPMPGEKQREQIWRSFFSDKTPLAGDVDFGQLAQQYAFSGGYIKNAVLRAIRHCAIEGIEHISQAVLNKAAQAEHASRWTNQATNHIGFYF